MLVLIVWAVALGLVLAVAGIVGFGLAGHLRRLQGALALLTDDLLPQAQQLLATQGDGRHRAGWRGRSAAALLTTPGKDPS